MFSLLRNERLNFLLKELEIQDFINKVFRHYCDFMLKSSKNVKKFIFCWKKKQTCGRPFTFQPQSVPEKRIGLI